MQEQFPPKTPGIYCILNKVNGKFYLGSSCQVPIRLTAHRSQLKSGIHKNPKLLNAWNKYGSDSFEYWLLESVADTPQLLSREQYWLDALQPYNDEIGYNIADRAEGGNWLGKKLPNEMREKIGRAHLGMKRSAEARENISKAIRGRTISAEQRKKISAFHKGRKRSTEVRARMSAATKRGWELRRQNCDPTKSALKGWRTRLAKLNAGA